MKYKIYDCEICKVSHVEAQGIIEAMLEYLPWPTLSLEINYLQLNGKATVIDRVKDFMYEITII